MNENESKEMKEKVKREKHEAFFNEVYKHNYEKVKEMIKNKFVDINIQNMEGTLLLQPYDHNLDFMKFLVYNGADLMIENWEYGGTPLTIIFLEPDHKEKVEITKFLLDYYTAYDLMLSLCQARIYNKKMPELIEKLVEFGVDLKGMINVENARKKEGEYFSDLYNEWAHKDSKLMEEIGKELLLEKERENEMKHRIIVRNLSYDTDEKILREYFTNFGRINKIEIPFSDKDNRFKGFAFITFSTQDEVNGILNPKVEHVIDNRKVKVELAKGKKDQNVERKDIKRIHISKLPLEVSVAELKDYFQQFGAVVDILLPTFKFAPLLNGYDQHKGFAFINFENSQSVSKILQQEKHILKDTLLIIQKSKPLEKNNRNNRNDNRNNNNRNDNRNNNNRNNNRNENRNDSRNENRTANSSESSEKREKKPLVVIRKDKTNSGENTNNNNNNNNNNTNNKNTNNNPNNNGNKPTTTSDKPSNPPSQNKTNNNKNNTNTNNKNNNKNNSSSKKKN